MKIRKVKMEEGKMRRVKKRMRKMKKKLVECPTFCKPTTYKGTSP
jgi:hypothetical protein